MDSGRGTWLFSSGHKSQVTCNSHLSPKNRKNLPQQIKRHQKKKIGAFLFPLLDLFLAKMESYFTNHTISLEKYRKNPLPKSLPFGGPGPEITLPPEKSWVSGKYGIPPTFVSFHFGFLVHWTMNYGRSFAFRDSFSTSFHDFSGERGGKSFDPHGFCGTSKVFKCSSAALRRIFSSKIRPSKAFSCGSCNDWFGRCANFFPFENKRWVPNVEVKIT